MFSRKIGCLLLCFASVMIRAQSVRLFSTDNDLSSSLINQVYQDSKGYIWIATEDGLNKYDGSKFTILKKQSNDSTSILHNYTKLIFENKENQLFFGFFNGLQLYDHQTETFTAIPLLLENNVNMAPHVTSMVERSNGDLIVGTTGHGIFEVDLENKVAHSSGINKKIPANMTHFLYEDRKGNFWVSTQNKGLYKIDKNEGIHNYFESSNFIDTVSCISEDDKGNIYVGSLQTGLHMYDEIKDDFVLLSKKDWGKTPVKSLYWTKNNQLLVGTDGKGMKIFDPEKNQLISNSFNVSEFDFSTSKIHSIIEDKSGNMWLGIFQKGVMFMPSKVNNFKYIGYNSFKKNIIGSNAVITLLKDYENTLWVGTDGNGLYGISLDGKQKSHLRNKNKDPLTIMSIYEDTNHELWVGSYSNGLASVNKKNGAFKYVDNILNSESNLVQHVFDITEDKNKNLWIATMGSGVFSLDLKTKEVTEYSELHNDWVSCLLYSSSEDKLYIGTYDGVGCLDLKTKSFTKTFSQKKKLAGKIIYDLYEDNFGVLWIGTSEGLVRHPINTDEFKVFTTESGLPNNVICAITSDDNNNLWISTNHGISKFDFNNNNFINYNFNDGLQGNEFSKNAVYSNEKDQVIFGGINGITYFAPNEIKNDLPPPRIQISGFYVQGVQVKKGIKSGKYEIIDKAILEANTFNLSYADNSFSIEFSTMEFINPERIMYTYSINGADWVDLRQGLNTLGFNNLDTGEYNLIVKAKDYKYYSKPKEITIIIHPVWYFSNWAKAAYFCVFALIGITIYKIAKQRHLAKLKIREYLNQSQIDEAKLNMFTNISHEIRTPMSLIISPLKKLIILDKNIERQKSYDVISRNSKKILHLMNQLMDVRKLDKGQIVLKFKETDIVKYAKEICLMFEEQLQTKNITFQISHKNEKLDVFFDTKYFDKVIQNVLSNAIKFTSINGKINFSIQRKNEHCQITITDNGIGIQKNDLERVFNRFYQVSNKNISSERGTGVGLHLTKSIVELHKGRIWAESIPEDEGCRFIITIPLGCNHIDTKDIIKGKTDEDKVLDDKNKQVVVAKSVSVFKTKQKPKTAYKILVVDDDLELRKYICEELAFEFNILESSNGKEALSKVINELPDLIISDVVMPVMDGITFCRKVKKNINVNHIPVILLTGKKGAKTNLEGLSIGADAYISKPFNIEILKETVLNIIHNRELLKTNFSGNQEFKDKLTDITLNSADEKFIQKIIDVINKNISNPDLSVETIANEIFISRVHLYRKLKKLTNQSPRSFIKNIKLKQAAMLLSSKHIDISEVSYITGFSNVSTFSRSFKELYGMSPKSYMQAHLNKKLEKNTDVI